MEQNHHHGNSESELAIDRQLQTVVVMNLFEEQPPYLNSFFRFQLGSNTFDGMYVSTHDVWFNIVCGDRHEYINVCVHAPMHTHIHTHTHAYIWTHVGYEFAMEAWKRVASVGATTIHASTSQGDQQVHFYFLQFKLEYSRWYASARFSIRK